MFWLHYFLSVSHLQHSDKQHQCSNGVHQAPIVGDQCIPATPFPDVEFFCVVVVAVVGGVVGHLVLDAGPRRARIAAAKGDPIHQVLPVHIAIDTAVDG